MSNIHFGKAVVDTKWTDVQIADKIEYWIKNHDERVAKAKRGQEFAFKELEVESFTKYFRKHLIAWKCDGVRSAKHFPHDFEFRGRKIKGELS